MTEIRPMNLPEDLDAWIAVTAAGFQYPDNPEWNYSPEEIENNVAGIRSLKQIWPLFALLRTFSADARDMIRGFFYEEDGKVVGNISCQRRGEAWYISDVVVLPEYRGKGYRPQAGGGHRGGYPRAGRQAGEPGCGQREHTGDTSSTRLRVSGSTPRWHSTK